MSIIKPLIVICAFSGNRLVTRRTIPAARHTNSMTKFVILRYNFFVNPKPFLARYAACRHVKFFEIFLNASRAGTGMVEDFERCQSTTGGDPANLVR
jgi:hypothetical protein